MEIGLQTRAAYRELLQAARWAEDRGLAAFAVPDHYLGAANDPTFPAWDHVVHLARLARETSRIQLVDLVSPVTFRYPAVHARMAATIHDMAGGRFTLGLGTGWMTEEHELFGFDFPSQRRRFAMLEEQLAYQEALATGKRVQRQALSPQGLQLSPAVCGSASGRGHWFRADPTPRRPVLR